MKSILSFIIALISCTSFAKTGDVKESRIFRQVVVNSDVEDLTVAKGKCLIKGKVFYEIEMDPYSTDFILATTAVQFIYDVDGKKIGSTDALGEFEVLVNVSTKYLLFSKKEDKDSLYEKIYFENQAFTSQHKMDISVYIPLKYSGRNIMVDKPVIYAYSKTLIDFTFKLVPQGILTFTYPQLPADSTWKMKTDERGNLTAASGSTYPYLFWESKQKNVHFEPANKKKNEIQGAVISKTNIVSYLDSTLNSLGFNFKEKTDFITFWAPKMQKENYYLIQFLQNEQCEKFANYTINPTPTHLNRLYMLFSGNNESVFPFEITHQKPEPLKRNGFYFVDWGGVEINLSNYNVAEKTH